MASRVPHGGQLFSLGQPIRRHHVGNDRARRASRQSASKCAPSHRSQLAPLHPVGNLPAPGALEIATTSTLASSCELTSARSSANIRKPFVAARASPAPATLSHRRKS